VAIVRIWKSDEKHFSRAEIDRIGLPKVVGGLIRFWTAVRAICESLLPWRSNLERPANGRWPLDRKRGFPCGR
jgi:hypothetical protein